MHENPEINEAVAYVQRPIKSVADTLVELILDRLEQLTKRVSVGAQSSAWPNRDEIKTLLQILTASFRQGVLSRGEEGRCRIRVGEMFIRVLQKDAQDDTAGKDVQSACFNIAHLFQAALPLLDGAKLDWPDPELFNTSSAPHS